MDSMEWFEFDDKTVEAIEELLASEPCSGAGVVLRLAWRAGLMREEIVSLTWDKVDFEHALLHLSDRSVPMDEDLTRCLRQWQTRCGSLGPYVAVSLHKRTHMRPESISCLARNTLNRAGLRKVRLADLHYNYILRRSAQEGWQDALRTSGLTLGIYRRSDKYKTAREAARAKKKSSPPSPPLDEQTTRERLDAVLEANRLAPAAVALRLSRETGAQYDELVALTLNELDLSVGALHIGSRSLPLCRETVELLREFCAQRQPDDDPHLFLSPNSRKPYPTHRLSILMRELLVQGGLDDLLPRMLRADAEAAARERQKEQLRERIAHSGRLTAAECAEELDITPNTAMGLLEELCADGTLMRDRGIYFPAGTGTIAQQREKAVRDYLAQHGPCGAQEMSEALGMSVRMIQRLIMPLCERGEIARERNEQLSGKSLLYWLSDAPNET